MKLEEMKLEEMRPLVEGITPTGSVLDEIDAGLYDDPEKVKKAIALSAELAPLIAKGFDKDRAKKKKHK